MSDQLSILHITPSAGSLTILLRDRLRRLTERGYKQWGMSGAATIAGDPTRQLRDVGVEFIESEFLTRNVDAVGDARFFAEVARTVRTHQPDIVMTYGPKPGVIARPAARLAGARVIHMHWGNVFDEESSTLKRTVFKVADQVTAFFSSDVCVENSDDLARLDRAWNRWTRFSYLGNATDTDGVFNPARFVGTMGGERRHELVGDGTLVVTLVGRMVPDKGMREFLGAATRVLRERSDLGVRFVHVGGQDAVRGQAVDVNALAGDLVDSGHLQLLGFVGHADMPLVYAASDIVVLPSYREGFPKSLVEAASMGLPLVATDIAGCREVVEHERNGLLIPTRDEAALYDAIVRLASSSQLRREYGLASRRLAVERLSADALVDRVVDVVERY